MSEENIIIRVPEVCTLTQQDEIDANEIHHNIRVKAINALKLPTNEKGEYLDIYGSVTSFSGMPDLKKVGAELPLTQLHVDEIKKCKKDVVYFAENYIQVTTPKGYRYAKLRGYQKELLRHYEQNRFNITLMGRQSAKSVTTIIYMLWKTIFTPEPMVSGIAAHVGSMAQENLSRLKTYFSKLPIWLQIGVVNWSKTFLILEGGKQILTSATTEDIFRGMSISGVVYLDEVAFIPGDMLDSIESSLIPALSQYPNAQIIYSSTPKGKNAFYEKWVLAEKGKSEFKAFKVEWYEVPGRNAEYKKNMINTLKGGAQQWAQEYECDFLGSALTLIQPSVLEHLEKVTLGIEPLTHEYHVFGIRQFNEPEPDHNYILSVDGAKDGLDDLCINVIDVTHSPFVQVVTANLQIEYLRMPFHIYNIAKDYNDALIIIENNEGAGQSITDALEYTYEYENLYRDPSKSYTGFRTSSKTRNLILSTLKMFIEKNYLELQDLLTVRQLNDFIDNGKGKYEAEKGRKDDLVMSLAIAFVPFINMKDFNNYHNFIEIIERNNNLYKEEQDEFSELMSLAIFSDGTEDDLMIGDSEYSTLQDGFSVMFGVDSDENWGDDDW